MYVTLVDSSWVVVASVLTGVDFIPFSDLTSSALTHHLPQPTIG